MALLVFHFPDAKFIHESYYSDLKGSFLPIFILIVVTSITSSYGCSLFSFYGEKKSDFSFEEQVDSQLIFIVQFQVNLGYHDDAGNQLIVISINFHYLTK